MEKKAIAGFALAIVSVLTAQFWIVSTITAVAAVSLALASRGSLRRDPSLRGTSLSLAAFLIAFGVLLFATVGPALFSLLLFAVAPPA